MNGPLGVCAPGTGRVGRGERQGRKRDLDKEERPVIGLVGAVDKKGYSKI